LFKLSATAACVFAVFLLGDRLLLRIRILSSVCDSTMAGLVRFLLTPRRRRNPLEFGRVELHVLAVRAAGLLRDKRARQNKSKGALKCSWTHGIH
jgi:hypothetical protein